VKRASESVSTDQSVRRIPADAVVLLHCTRACESSMSTRALAPCSDLQSPCSMQALPDVERQQNESLHHAFQQPGHEHTCTHVCVVQSTAARGCVVATGRDSGHKATYCHNVTTATPWPSDTGGAVHGLRRTSDDCVRSSEESTCMVLIAMRACVAMQTTRTLDSCA
jgi:hypothetical protein